MLLLIKLALIALAGELIATIGKSRISDLVYSLYTAVVPSPLSKQQKALRNEIVAATAELRATSSQDEFAKWARLRRKLDKQVADLDAIGKQITATKASSQWLITSCIFAATTILPFLYTTRHSKSAVFYLPHGWFGATGEWVLGLPLAPMGSVSCAVWMMAVRSVFKLVKRCADEFIPAPAPVAAHQMPVGLKTEPDARKEL